MKNVSGLDDREMLRTFNNGVGMVLIVKADKVIEAKKILEDEGEIVYDLGVLVEGEGELVIMRQALQ
jgi:phosphoribosylformylglycinamidine cyclo-ligase